MTKTTEVIKATKVKFCGITRLDDALAAVRLGVDALGFVFYEPSPRNISPEQARAIIRQLPPFVTRVGLFVNASDDVIRSITEYVGLDVIQLHGDESPEFCEQFQQPVIKALRVNEGAFIPQPPERYDSVSAVLLDAYSQRAYGGTGHTFDWSVIPRLSMPIILAGGLHPENVAQAIALVKPYAVDVSGGIEGETKGCKDQQRMQAFLKAVRSY